MNLCLTTVRNPSAGDRVGRDKEVLLEWWDVDDGSSMRGLSFGAESKESGAAGSLLAILRSERAIGWARGFTYVAIGCAGHRVGRLGIRACA